MPPTIHFNLPFMLCSQSVCDVLNKKSDSNKTPTQIALEKGKKVCTIKLKIFTFKLQNEWVFFFFFWFDVIQFCAMKQVKLVKVEIERRLAMNGRGAKWIGNSFYFLFNWTWKIKHADATTVIVVIIVVWICQSAVYWPFSNGAQRTRPILGHPLFSVA